MYEICNVNVDVHTESIYANMNVRSRDTKKSHNQLLLPENLAVYHMLWTKSYLDNVNQIMHLQTIKTTTERS